MSMMGKRVSIVGGTGKMGRWFAVFFKKKGFDVVISGRRISKAKSVAAMLGVKFAPSIREAVVDADVVVVATPIDVTAETIRKVSTYLKRGAVLFDIASIKRNVVGALERVQTRGVHVLSLHPMFGPGTKSVAGKNVAIIPVGKRTAVTDAVSKLFSDEGASVRIIKNAELHDEMMASTLSLPHFINLLFGRVLSSLGIDINELKKYAGTTFTLQILITESILREDPALYASIQIENEAFHHLLKKVAEYLGELREIVITKDKEKFIDFFEKSRRYVAEDTQFADAYEKFNLAVKSATKSHRQAA